MLDKRIYWIWLVLVFGAANPRIWQLGERFVDVESIVRSLMNGSVKELTDEEKLEIKKHSLDDAEKLLSYCENKGINVYCYESEGYPEKLKAIANPPSVLFCYGSLDLLNDKICIAVVGTRKPSEYSVKVTEKLCRQLSERNVLLASGFAQGIDRIANEVSLDMDVPSVAVTGAAIEDDYPKDSEKLKMLISQKGVVVSEQCSGLKVHSNPFVQRNRILIGISDGVVFCECSDKSMGLDNAKHAAVQGKSIFVIPPHDIFEPRYFGQRDLLRNGATAVFGGTDITLNLAYSSGENISQIYDYKLISDELPEYKTKSKKKSKRGLFSKKAKNKEVRTVKNVEQSVDYSSLDETQQKICKALENGNLLVDEIVIKTGEDVSTVLSNLIELELEGIIKAYPGKVYGIEK